MVSDKVFPTTTAQKQAQNCRSLHKHCVGDGGSRRQSYPISKFALSRMAEVFAMEYEKEGLVAIAFNHGDVPTGMSRKLPGKASVISQDKPELAGNTLVFLTKERRQWLSGRMITSNWDMEEFLAKRDQIITKNLLNFRFDTSTYYWQFLQYDWYFVEN
ncbi:unnamed protein product [Clonostachys chloroleuca]|uniref:Uncharacterized protein n=1 Tax=Clonostachys chloroleuca TaxID=1926264 RepID=A0AA35Q0U5_9HYPO|nr:unnamed protein product [Clonostachys chloroleuca]